MEIRLLKKDDASLYWNLRLEALKLNPEAFGSSYEEAINRVNPLEIVMRKLENEANFTLGVLNEDTLIGMVALKLETRLKLKHKANITSMYVRPNMRGIGIGEKLLKEAITLAQSLKTIEKLNLVVVSSNISAKKLYTKLGFRIYGKETNALKINHTYYDEELMELYL